MRAIFLCVLCYTALANPWWNLIREIMDKQTVFSDLCLNVGREKREFSHCIGNMTMTKQIPVASSSKLVSAMAFYEKVLSGEAKLGDKVSDYLDYWTTNVSDSRAHITLRHLVMFQSGYQSDPLCEGSSKMTLSQCVKHYYENVEHKFMPGTNWAYGEVHLQILGAVMEQIYKADIATILADGLKRYNMTHSKWENGDNPILAGSLATTGDDYEQFLIRYLGFDIITPDMTALLEGAYNTHPEVTSTALNNILMLFVGHYGMTTWFQCSMAITSIPNMRPQCYIDNKHSCPGLMGYWPVIDRRNNYWMQVVVDGAPILGCISGQFAELIFTPFVNAAMKKRLLSPEEYPDIDALMERYEEALQDTQLHEALALLTPSHMK